MSRSPTTASLLAVTNLLASYAALVDAGDFVALGQLFAHASVSFADPVGGDDLVLGGADAVQRAYEVTTRRYEDSTPRTRHLVSNPIVSIDEDAGTADRHSCVTVLQQTALGRLEAIWTIRYDNRFERVDGRWRFSSRRGHSHIAGDVSQHLFGGLR
jgi:3-phenylpropionate/cinnamic acid dioxygenase small subunit